MSLQFSKKGWLFNQDGLSNKAHELSESDLLNLIELSYVDDEKSNQLQKQVNSLYSNPQADYYLTEICTWLTSGTMITYPFGDIVTFGTRNHLYRGERKLFSCSIPTLNRKTEPYNANGQKLICALENLRIVQFEKFLQKTGIHIVPYWEARICDVNYKALAQHYGFATHLLDLTNDFRTALFFATCKYDFYSDKYVPLSKQDIDSGNEMDQYGMIFHIPDWKIDCLMKLSECLSLAGDKWPIEIDSAVLEGFAFQIGYQPLYRCHVQHGYVLPMRTLKPLQKDLRFEKLYFRQSSEFSRHVFELMHEGKDVFPFEGIAAATKTLRIIQNSYQFSEDDLSIVYENEIDKKDFPTFKAFAEAMTSTDIFDGRVRILKEEIDYPIEEPILKSINSQYDNVDLLAMFGGNLRMKPYHIERRKEICASIFGPNVANEWFGAH